MKSALNIVPSTVLLLLPLLLPGCGWFGSDEIPDALVGRWVTSAPRYEEAELGITKETITFSRGLEFFHVNEIERVEIDDVEIEPEEGKTLIHITYEGTGGGEYTLSIYHFPGARGGNLQFVNQPKLVWTRAQDQ
jgi:hypothetical protein